MPCRACPPLSQRNLTQRNLSQSNLSQHNLTLHNLTLHYLTNLTQHNLTLRNLTLRNLTRLTCRKYFKVPKSQHVWSVLKIFQSAEKSAGLVSNENFFKVPKRQQVWKTLTKKRSEGPEHKALAPHSKKRGKNQRLLPFTPV